MANRKLIEVEGSIGVGFLCAVLEWIGSRLVTTWVSTFCFLDIKCCFRSKPDREEVWQLYHPIRAVDVVFCRITLLISVTDQPKTHTWWSIRVSRAGGRTSSSDDFQEPKLNELNSLPWNHLLASIANSRVCTCFHNKWISETFSDFVRLLSRVVASSALRQSMDWNATVTVIAISVDISRFESIDKADTTPPSNLASKRRDLISRGIPDFYSSFSTRRRNPASPTIPGILRHQTAPHRSCSIRYDYVSISNTFFTTDAIGPI